MRSRVFLLASLVLLLGVVSAAARDIFVDNVAGDDRFTGHRQAAMPDGSGPVRTIEKALRLARQGDRIQVQKTGVPYRESITLSGSRHSGFPQEPFVVSGNGAVLDGSAPVPAKAWAHYRGAVFRFQPARVQYQQLFLSGQPLVRVPAGGTAGEPPKLEPLQWCLEGAYIYFAVQPQKLPAAYTLSCAAKPAGINLLSVENVVIRDFTVQGFQLDGISVLNNARSVRLVGLTARSNGRSGVSVGGASLVEIDKCLLAGNGYAQLLTLPYSQTYIRQSEIVGRTAPAWIDQGGKVFLDGKEIHGGLDTLSAKPGSK